MLFTSYSFILFLAVVFAAYYIVPGKVQWIVLTAAGIFFYACADPRDIFWVLLTTFFIYISGISIQRISDQTEKRLSDEKETLSREQKTSLRKSAKAKQKGWVAAASVSTLFLLFLAKYTPLSSDGLWFFVVPLGISFYTLQAIGYVVDVYHHKTRAQKNFLKLFLFISFFPLSIQGPISSYPELSKTLYGPHRFDGAVFSYGLQRILWGFFKKLVIADRLSPVVTGIMGDPSKRGAYIFAGMFLYTFELYADFSGGIDITIGTAQALGITLEENFKRPFFATSLKEYWRRWHITMCNWFRSYIFYPVSMSKPIRKITHWLRKHLGGNPAKRVPVYLSSLIVWAATGIWHGAGWNFFSWGIANWLILMIAEEFSPRAEKFRKERNLDTNRGYRAFQMIRTFLLVTILNLFDCFQTAGQTFSAFFSIFTKGNWKVLGDGSLLQFGAGTWDFVVAFAGVLVMFLVDLYEEKHANDGEMAVRRAVEKKSYLLRAVLWGGLFVVIIVFGSYGIGYNASQFIYNRF